MFTLRCWEKWTTRLTPFPATVTYLSKRMYHSTQARTSALSCRAQPRRDFSCLRSQQKTRMHRMHLCHRVKTRGTDPREPGNIVWLRSWLRMCDDGIQGPSSVFVLHLWQDLGKAPQCALRRAWHLAVSIFGFGMQRHRCVSP